MGAGVTGSRRNDAIQRRIGVRASGRALVSAVSALLLTACTLGGPDLGEVGLWLVDADGGNLTHLVRAHSVEAVSPRWSPDGRRIAFVGADQATGQHGTDILAVNDDGNGQVNLTADIAEQCIGHDWAPDGRRIAVWCLVPGRAVRIYVVRTDGGAPVLLTEQRLSGSNGGVYPGLDWAPAGDRLAFVTGSTTESGLYVIRHDGEGLVDLTPDATAPRYPVWSPDGTQLAFCWGSDFTAHLDVIGADGAERRQLTDSGWCQDPSWSPDGKWIAAAVSSGSVNAGTTAIVTVRTNGAELNHIAAGMSPSWSPDGTRLTYISLKGRTTGVAVIGADGSSRRQLLTSKLFVGAPRWSPDGARIAFTRHGPRD